MKYISWLNIYKKRSLESGLSYIQDARCLKVKSAGGSQFSRLLAVEECGSAGRPRIDHVPRHIARVVDTLSNRLFPLHFPSHASPCAITFLTDCTAFLLLNTAVIVAILDLISRAYFARMFLPGSMFRPTVLYLTRKDYSDTQEFPSSTLFLSHMQLYRTKYKLGNLQA